MKTYGIPRHLLKVLGYKERRTLRRRNLRRLWRKAARRQGHLEICHQLHEMEK